MHSVIWLVAWIAVMTGGGLADSQEYPFDQTYNNGTTTTVTTSTSLASAKPTTANPLPYLMMPDIQRIQQAQRIWQLHQQRMQRHQHNCLKKRIWQRVHWLMEKQQHAHEKQMWETERRMMQQRLQAKPKVTTERTIRKIIFPGAKPGAKPGDGAGRTVVHQHIIPVHYHENGHYHGDHHIQLHYFPGRGEHEVPGTGQHHHQAVSMERPPHPAPEMMVHHIQHPMPPPPQLEVPHPPPPPPPPPQMAPPLPPPQMAPPQMAPPMPPPQIHQMAMGNQATIQTCPIPDTTNPELLEQGLALIELLRTVGQDRAHKLIRQLYPQHSAMLIEEYQRWRYAVLDPWVHRVLEPGMHSDQPIGCPPLGQFRLASLHSAWLLAFLRDRYGFERAQQLGHRLFGMVGVRQMLAAEAWKQNVLGPWMENIHPSRSAWAIRFRRLMRYTRRQRWYAAHLREEHHQLMRMRRYYSACMHREERLLRRREYRQLMHHMLGDRFHRFLDQNHSPYYLFLSREMRRWIYTQHRIAQRQAKHRLHHWRLRNDPRYYRRHHYIRGIFPVLHSILTSRRSYWRWHRRMHWRVRRAWRWRRMLNKVRRYYPHRRIPFRLLNRSYLCYVKWVRRLSPFDIRNPLNPFNPHFGFGAPQSRCFRRWIRSMRHLPRWYWKTHRMRFRLPYNIARYPRFWWRLPRYRMRPWYLRAPWKYSPRFNPYWPRFHRPRFPRFNPRWPYWRRPSFRWPYWRRPSWRWPYWRRPSFMWPFRNPFRNPFRYFWNPFRNPFRNPWNPFRRPWWMPRLPRFRRPWWMRPWWMR